MATVTPVSIDSVGPDAQAAASTPHAVPTLTVIPQSVSSISSVPAIPAVPGKARYTDPSSALPPSSSSSSAASKAQYLHETTRALLLWEDPLRSALVLSAILGANYLIAHYSPVKVISFALGAATLANLVFVNAWTYGSSLFAPSTANRGVKKPPTMWFLDNANRQPLSHSFIREWSDLFVDIVNVSVSSVASIVAVDDSKQSIEALAGIGFVYLLSCYISSGTLFLIATVIGFLAPRIYLANKTLVDGHLENTRGVISGHLQTLQGTLAKHYNSAAEQAKIKIAATQKVKKTE